MLINFHYFLLFLKCNKVLLILLLIFRVSESIVVNLMENEKEAESGCRWHNIDVLFVSDSTENIGEENHRILMNFFISVLKKLGKDDETIHIAMAQFTPEAKYEFSFDSLSSRVQQNIKNVPYTPCRNPDCRSRATSINGIAATALSSDKGNRIISPDILIVVSTSLYQIPELNSGELLIKPASITHAFLITVGNFAPSNGAKVRLQFAATTSQLGAINFESLSELISPLCHSVASFLLVMAEFSSIFGQNNKSLSGQPADLTWWNYLKWDVPTCTRTNEKNTVFWTVACDSDTSNSAAGTITTSTFVLILACVIVTALIFILIFGCAIYRYRNETFKLQSKLKKEQQNFQKVDEYYRSKLREKSAQEKEREKAMVELINESNKIRDHYREQATQHQHEIEQQTARAEKAEKNPPQQNNQSSQLPQLIPIPSQYYLPFPAMPQFPPGQFPNLQYPNDNQHHHRGDYDGDATNQHHSNDNRYPHGSPRNPGEITRGEENRPNNDRPPPNRDQIPPLRRSSSSDYERDEFATDTTDSKEFAFDRTQSHLASDHPARTLPPVDVLLLIDASSSIGNNQFEQVKIFLKDFINDIDIAPGRSRLCVILFAAEPQVFFGFDRFYSIKSIRRAIGKMPYLGGATFLAKALSFAAGVLYQEQNMKSGRFRKHKFMPTPRHDRLQAMIVVSDGASDDNFDKQATHLHEKMLVKIAAVVTKSFNKDRLLPITRFDGSVFLLDQQQALSIWLWRQQRMWTENFAEYVEREKTLTNLMESSRHPQQPESPKKSKKKKQQPKPETKRTN